MRRLIVAASQAGRLRGPLASAHSVATWTLAGGGCGLIQCQNGPAGWGEAAAGAGTTCPGGTELPDSENPRESPGGWHIPGEDRRVSWQQHLGCDRLELWGRGSGTPALVSDTLSTVKNL